MGHQRRYERMHRARDGRGGRRRLWTVLAGLVALAVAGLVTLRTGSPPRVALHSDLPGIGRRTTVEAEIGEPSRGLYRVRLELLQGERVELLAERQYSPRPAWQLWGGDMVAADALAAAVGTELQQHLEAGDAVVRASAWPAPTWLRHPPPVVEEMVLPVRLRPPTLELLSTQHYPTQGGVGAVAYRVGESAVSDGVEVGTDWFPGYPLPGAPAGERFALFAVPADLAGAEAIRLVASDDVRNRAERAFVDRLRSRRYRADTINVEDAFIERVAPEIEAQTPDLETAGSLLDRFLAINRDLRVENRTALAALAADSRPEPLWRGSFLALPNGKAMAGFGDHRTYLYGGQPVDEEDHLGVDLASVRHAEVPAANDGIVLHAGFFGIYGNAVVLDHGCGLATLYGHLSSLEVAVGDSVARGQILGHTGATGLAGGDHLHFGVFLQGHAVDPVEWWDGDWIRQSIDAKLGSAP